MAVQELLQKEFDWYIANQEDLVARFNGRVIAVKNGEVLGDYDTYLDALRETAKNHEEGTFLLQKVSPGEQDYTATFRRVAF